jgi:hypothetical protein
VFLDGVVPRIEAIQRGVDLVRLDLDQEAEVSEVDAQDGDGPRRDEPQRAEPRSLALRRQAGARLRARRR